MKLDVEWLDAPGVEDRVLAATWARLRISAGDRDITDVVHVGSNTRRSAVYGAVFPVVEWLVESWWHILNEPAPTSPLRAGRDAPPWTRGWVRRHNLLAAREGFALPDASFVRDGDEVVVAWFPDPGGGRDQRIRFVGSGEVRVPLAEFERAVVGLVTATLQRLREVVGANEDVERVASAWQAIRSADAGERELCSCLAVLGADPYDPDEGAEVLVRQVQELIDELPPELRHDLFEGTKAGELTAAGQWVRSHRKDLTKQAGDGPHPTLRLQWDASAHGTGYEFARRVRRELLDLAPDVPISNLDAVLVEQLGWDPTLVKRAESAASLQGLVGISSSSARPLLVDPYPRQGRGRRFLLARAAFFPASGSLGEGRLLTSAVTRQQRAARAFAAELLAPASALARRVSGLVSETGVAELAEEFDVSTMLIQHQIENHNLGVVAV